MACSSDKTSRPEDKALGARLDAAWRKAIEDGRIFQVFDAPEDDPSGRWARGDRVGYGVGLRDGNPVNQARNLSTGQDLAVEVREKRLEPWGFVVQSHDFRTLRPGYHAVGRSKAPNRCEPSPECGFFCADATHPLSLLNRSALVSVPLLNRTWHAYPNAAPLDPAGHFLWVPAETGAETISLPHQPQRLSLEFIEDVVELSRRCADLVIFFNAIGAGASVDHIHIQAVARSGTLPIEAAPVIAYRDALMLDGYPAQAWVFELKNGDRQDACAAEISAYVERLQAESLPFGLVMTGGRAFLVPRNRVFERAESWGGCIVAGLEVAGRIVSLVDDAFSRIDAAAVTTALAQACLSVRELTERWR